MIGLPAGTRIWIASGVTDLRRGFTGLSAMVQTALKENPFSGHVFVFRGRRGDLIKMLWWDGDGLCLFAKRLERGRFLWPLAKAELHCHLSEIRMMPTKDRGEWHYVAEGSWNLLGTGPNAPAFGLAHSDGCGGQI
jgi:transposase